MKLLGQRDDLFGQVDRRSGGESLKAHDDE